MFAKSLLSVVLFVFSFIGAVALSGPVERIKEPPKLVERCTGPECELKEFALLEAGTVTILAGANEDATNAEGWGTGFFFHAKNGQTFVWAASHVLRYAITKDETTGEQEVDKSVTAVKPVYNALGQRQSRQTWACTVVRYCTKTDLSLLKIEAIREGHGFKFATDKTKVKLGTKLFHAGTMLGPERGLYFSEGRVGHLYTILNGPAGIEPFYQVNISLRPGSSGGPVINSNGEVVGMLTRTASDGFAFAVPHYRMRAWADLVNAKWAYDNTVDVPDDLGPIFAVKD